MTYKLRILSLGAGVQSTCLYLMAEKGEIEPFHCAIFADTGWEHVATYQHLEWLKSVGKTPIIITNPKYGSIYDWHLEAKTRGKKFMCMPFFTSKDNGHGMLRRQCTNDFKISPIRSKVREMLGVGNKRIPEGAVEMCMGISIDEASRVFNSNVKYIYNKFPLIDMRMSRWDCEVWLAKNYDGLVVPKSACVGCPFRSNIEWLNIKAVPEEWNQAITLDNEIRRKGINTKYLDNELYLHSSCQPLSEVNLEVVDPRQGQFDFMRGSRLEMMTQGLKDL